MALVLLIAAFILLLLAAFGVAYRRIHFGWLALAILVLAIHLLPHLP